MPNDASRKDPHKLALVIGIGDYDHIPKLNNPKNDAEAMSAKLESIGFTVKRVFHPNRLEMKVAVSEFEESINESDMVLFYFAGHGVQWENINYLLPKNMPTEEKVNQSKQQDLNGHAITVQYIIDQLTARGPYAVVCILDCCRSYHLRHPQLAKHADSRGDGNSEPASFVPMRYAGTYIAYACAPGTKAKENGKEQNGLFTKHVLKHITTQDEDIDVMFRAVIAGVKAESGGKQCPNVESGLPPGNMYLNRQSERA
ncbi:unnamed protein product [Rotaria magnacalcarata]|uniref:Caspase family p20 domain-containing protein n=1 Tax=Rotaria magnacalcarata TaxID=392030 RepID=A0A815MDN2_9BILA|nr:unnamed protein product [Rotaria magnacalcarata]CAF4490370.1 unnamed protein product [Rotaria magnacalcarata]